MHLNHAALSWNIPRGQQNKEIQPVVAYINENWLYKNLPVIIIVIIISYNISLSSMSNNCIISILLYGSLWCFPIFHGDVFLEGEVLSLSQAKVWQQRREEAAALEGRLRYSAAGPLGL